MDKSKGTWIEGFPDPEFIHTDGNIATAMTWLKTNKDNFAGVANYIIVGGRYDETRIHAPCHAGTLSISIGSRKESTLIGLHLGHSNRSALHSSAGYENVDLSFSDAEPFLKWWAQESFCSPYIINKDDIEEMWNVGVLVTTNIPTILLQVICIISRHFYECTVQSFKMFNKLILEGTDPYLAWAITFTSNYSRKGNTYPMVASFGEGHRGASVPSIRMIRNLLAHRLGGGQYLTAHSSYRTENLLDKKFWYTHGWNSYYGGSRLFENTGWDTSTDGDFVRYLIRNSKSFAHSLSGYRKDKVSSEVYSPPNPFSPNAQVQRIGPGQVSNEELFEFVLPYITKNGVPSDVA